MPVQLPLWQVSPVVHALPSLQAVPFATAEWVYPVLGLHESVVQALLSLQEIAVPVHVPFWQESPVVQALPSLQEMPFATAVWTQAPVELTESAVHGLPSSQLVVVHKRLASPTQMLSQEELQQ